MNAVSKDINSKISNVHIKDTGIIKIMNGSKSLSDRERLLISATVNSTIAKITKGDNQKTLLLSKSSSKIRINLYFI